MEEGHYAGSREILDATRQIEAEKILEQRFQKYVDLARATTPAGKWLDIGCGGGLLVELAQRAGYQGEAIELNADRRKIAEQVTGAVVHGVPVEDCADRKSTRLNSSH